MRSLKYWLTLLWLLPLTASAQNQIIPPKIDGLPGDTGSTFNYQLTWLINVVLGVVGLVAVAYLIYGGFRYITSQGNEEVAEEAKKTIQNSIIGLVIIICSYIIIVVIANALLTGTV